AGGAGRPAGGRPRARGRRPRDHHVGGAGADGAGLEGGPPRTHRRAGRQPGRDHGHPQASRHAIGLPGGQRAGLSDRHRGLARLGSRRSTARHHPGGAADGAGPLPRRAGTRPDGAGSRALEGARRPDRHRTRGRPAGASRSPVLPLHAGLPVDQPRGPQPPAHPGARRRPSRALRRRGRARPAAPAAPSRAGAAGGTAAAPQPDGVRVLQRHPPARGGLSPFPLVVLGLDTATWTAAVGVVRDQVVLAEDVEPASRSHVTSLPGLIERVLAQAGLGIGDVEGLAISIGPGSFTGLRIGLGLMKGLAFAGGIPLAAVSTLEALAAVSGAEPGQTVCAALDARKREVYAAVFDVGDGGALRRRGPDVALAPDALVAGLPAGTVLVGDAAATYPELRDRVLVVRPFATHPPRGGTVARMGARLLAAGAAVDVG